MNEEESMIKMSAERMWIKESTQHERIIRTYLDHIER